MVVHTCTNSDLIPGDEFAFQVYGTGRDAYFNARLKVLQGAEMGPFVRCVGRIPMKPVNLGCEIISDMTFKEGLTQPRFCVEGVTVDLSADDELLTEGGIVIDVGPGGFAAITDLGLKKWDHADAVISAFDQTVCCRVEVRNCVRNGLDPNVQRTGMKILDMERVDGLRWKQVYNTIIDFNRKEATTRIDSSTMRRRDVA